MMGTTSTQSAMFHHTSVEQLVPVDDPLRAIEAVHAGAGELQLQEHRADRGDAVAEAVPRARGQGEPRAGGRRVESAASGCGRLPGGPQPGGELPGRASPQRNASLDVAHQHGTGVIVVTHDQRALDVFDTIYEMEDGVLARAPAQAKSESR